MDARGVAVVMGMVTLPVLRRDTKVVALTLNGLDVDFSASILQLTDSLH